MIEINVDGWISSERRFIFIFYSAQDLCSFIDQMQGTPSTQFAQRVRCLDSSNTSCLEDVDRDWRIMALRSSILLRLCSLHSSSHSTAEVDDSLPGVVEAMFVGFMPLCCRMSLSRPASAKQGELAAHDKVDTAPKLIAQWISEKISLLEAKCS